MGHEPGQCLLQLLQNFEYPKQLCPGLPSLYCWTLSCVQHFATPRTTSRQPSPSFTISQSLLKLTSIESVEMTENTITKAMTSYHVPEDVLLCFNRDITSETETKSRVNSWMSLQESTTRYEGRRYDGANHPAFFNSLRSLICTIHRNVILFSVCVWFG